MAEAYTVLRDFELEEIGNNEWRLKTFIGFDTPECIEIPAEIDGKKIVEIGKKLFFGNKDLKQVKIAEGIRVIGESAFEDCILLQNVVFPASLEIIGKHAFDECTLHFMSEVKFPKNIIEIGEYAFPYCTEKFIFPIECRAVLKSNFVQCYKESHAQFNASIQQMWPEDRDAFYEAGLFKRNNYIMYIPSTVTVEKLVDLHGWNPSCVILYCHAGSSAMAYARSQGMRCEDYDKAIKEIQQKEEKKLAEKKKREAAKQFRNLPLSERDTIFEGDFPKDIESVVIPAHVKIIKENAFNSYTYRRLHSISFAPNSQLEIIEDKAFEGCEIKMDKLIIPKSVKKIGERAFHFSCSVDPDVELVFEEGSMLEEIGESAFHGLSFKCKDVKKAYELKLPKYIRKVGKGAFESNSSVAKVDMSACAELRTLPQDMFSYCSNLTQVVLPPNLEFIQRGSSGGIFDCTKIASLTLPDSCKRVEEHAFSMVSALKKLIVPQDCEVANWAVRGECKVIRQKGSTASGMKQESTKGGFMSKLKNFFGQLKD